MAYVFKPGDEVYHSLKGKGKVIRISTDQLDDTPYCVEWDVTWATDWQREKLLSFEPWPEPVHVRPFNKGWYVLLLQDKSYRVEYLTKELSEEVELVHFLGARMPEGLK